MKDSRSEFLKGLLQARRCRRDVQEMAGRLATLGEDACSILIERLVRAGEDRALGILLQACTVGDVRLDPDLLAATLPVVEPLTDFALPYRFQDESAIPALLHATQREDLSWERQALAGQIAAEIAVRFNAEKQSVKKALLKLKTRIFSQELQWLVGVSLSLLEGYAELPSSEFLVRDTDPLKELPEEEEPLIIGAGFTVRRAVPKLSRNAPCHCGSGKKYKKCCYENDQGMLRDASPYKGMTMTQVRAAPEEVDDASLIHEMHAYELKKLDPAKMSPDQLFAAYQRADLFGLRDLAYNMLLELERRPGKNGFDRGHFIDLLDSALDAGNAILAERILEHTPLEQQPDAEALKTLFYLLKHPEHFKGLETECRKAVSGDPEHLADDPLVRLAYFLERTFPALSIVFARAFISGNPDRHLDNIALLDMIRSARAEIGLDALSDPVEGYPNLWMDEIEDKAADESESKEVRRLASETSRARREVEKKAKELQDKEKQLQKLISKMEDDRRRRSADPPSQPVQQRERTQEDKETILRLRRRIESLKGEIRSQQEHRRRLRSQLQAERRKVPAPEGPGEKMENAPAPNDFQAQSRIVKKVAIPEFATAFRRASETTDPSVVAKALKASAAFAANDPLAWRQTKPIKRMPGFYRIRIGKDYRVILRWAPDKEMEVLDLIPRAQLESWIKCRAQ
jgi:hypothetical protein